MFDNKPFSWIVLLTVALILGTLGSSAAADWKPSGPIKMMIAFRAGGGADTQARLIAEELQKRHGWKIIPTQVTGKGGINLARALAKSPNDGTVIGITVTETFGYNLVVSKKSGLKLSDFT
ncbi:MAG: tripartite tricarboxylate transporter substrate-binding protein, partial [Proteobacteria bacterium]|nr:tripartite tricarboxylate transporter substrate-binding protein [Pseudomonadota bacterium]